MKFEHYKKKINYKNIFKEIFLVYIIAVIFVMFFNAIFIQAFKIHSNSMEPQIVDRTWLLVNKFIYGPKYPFTEKKIFDSTYKIKRGDIIIFMSKEYMKTNNFYRTFSSIIYTLTFTLVELPNLLKDKEENIYIKRVVGIPGDKIKYKEINGKIELFINDLHEKKIIDNDYNIIEDNTKYPLLKEYIIKKNEFYVLGDNRKNSIDSRTWGRGIKSDQIIGKAILTYHPKISIIK